MYNELIMPVQFNIYAMPKNRLMFPAKGTDSYLEFWFIVRCKINEKINENTKRTTKAVVGKEHAIAKNISMSPNAMASSNLIFSLSRVYTNTMLNKSITKDTLTNIVARKTDWSRCWNKSITPSIAISGNRNQYTLLCFKSCINIIP